MAPWWRNKELWGWIVGSALLGGAVAGIEMLLHPASPQEMAYVPPTPGCTSPMAWTPITSAAGPSATPLNAGWRWWTGGVIRGRVCTPGTLQLAGTGQRFESEVPQVAVTLDGQTLSQLAFNGEVSTTIPIPRAGEINVFFLNAFARAQVRFVEVHGCGNTMRLVGSQSLKVPECPRYTLRRVSEAYDEPAQVEVTTPEGTRTESVRLESEVLNAQRLRLLNPLYKDLGSRQLTFSRLEFQPE